MRAQWMAGSRERRPEPYTVRFDDRQTPVQRGHESRFAGKPFNDGADDRRGRIVRQPQNDDAGILLRRIVPDVGEIQVTRQQHSTGRPRALGDLVVRGRSKSDVTSELDLVSEHLQNCHCRPRHIGVNEEPHDRLFGWKWME